MMKTKQKPAKKQPADSPRIAALLTEAGESVDSQALSKSLPEKLAPLTAQEQEEFFLALLRKDGEKSFPLLESILGSNQATDLALVRSLGHWNSPLAGERIHRIVARNSSPAVLKASRRSLFQLKSRGREVQPIAERGSSVYHPVGPVPSEGYLSLIDARGARLVLLVRPQPLQGVFTFQGLISDTEGIVDFTGFESSRRKFMEYLEEYRAGGPYEIIAADPEYCLGLIIEASGINKDKERPLPEGFLKLRDLMGTPPELPLRPLIYAYVPAEEMKSRTDLLDRSGGLLELPAFRGWILDETETAKYLNLLQDASESRLVLAPYQKEARVMEIYRQAVDELFDPPARARMRRRLEEMAYFLWKTGQENESRIAVAASLTMQSEGGILSVHPFLLELVRRSLRVRSEEEEAEKKKRESELLIKP